MSHPCRDCGVHFSWYNRAYTCELCHKPNLCSTCANHAAITGGFSNGDLKVLTACLDCAKRSTTIDYSSYVDIMGPENGTAPCVLLVHGGGSSRKMWIAVSRELVAAGYRCVMPDLPGHGSRINEPLSLESCLAVLRECKEQHCAAYRGVEPIYFGGSFGGYVGMELIGRHPSMFSAAIIVVATQSYRSLKAKLAMWAMGAFGPRMWCSTMVRGLLDMVKKDPAHMNLADLDEGGVRGGWWFEQSKGQVETLLATDSIPAVEKYSRPVLYITGALDYHDMEQELLHASRLSESKAVQAAGNRHPARTQSLIYPGVTHFLTHDNRSQQRFHTDVVAFCRQVVADVTSTEATPAAAAA